MTSFDLHPAPDSLEQQHLKTEFQSGVPGPDRMLRLLIAFEGASYEDSQAIAASVAIHAPWRDKLAFLQEIAPHIAQDGRKSVGAPAYARRGRRASAAALVLAGLNDWPDAFHSAVRLLRTTSAKPPALIEEDSDGATHTLREVVIAALGVSIGNEDRVSVKPTALQDILDGALNCTALEVKCFVMINAEAVLNRVERFAPRARLSTRDWLALRNRLSILQEQLHSVGVISGLTRSLSASVLQA